MVRILHTADLQLGKQFENLGAPSDKLAFLRQGLRASGIASRGSAVQRTFMYCS